MQVPALPFTEQERDVALFHWIDEGCAAINSGKLIETRCCNKSWSVTFRMSFQAICDYIR